MEEECADLKNDAAKAGDDYYRAMTAWATSGRTLALRERALKMALVYRKALSWVIECYHRVSRYMRKPKPLEDAIEFKAMLDKDIETLEKSSPRS